MRKCDLKYYVKEVKCDHYGPENGECKKEEFCDWKEGLNMNPQKEWFTTRNQEELGS